jgi:DNA gyrase inhibitor GyrI
MTKLFFLFFLFGTTTLLQAYQSMYEKTPVGEIKIIELPARLALEARTEGSYFETNNGLFRKLFRYISSNDISMTTPVEADINPGKMRFFVGGKDKLKKLRSNDSVKVIKIPACTVVSIGIRGGYSEEKFSSNKVKLIAWLEKNPQFEKAAEPYGVYWNGPFVPGLFKRSEIHLPIQSKSKTSKK